MGWKVTAMDVRMAAALANGVDDVPDDRSPGQRRHDAMAEAAARLLRSASLPAAGGSPVTVLATTTITELTTAAGTSQADTGPVAGKGNGLALLGHGQVV